MLGVVFDPRVVRSWGGDFQPFSEHPDKFRMLHVESLAIGQMQSERYEWGPFEELCDILRSHMQTMPERQSPDKDENNRP